MRAQSEVPIIFLTAYDDEVNVVMGLDMGADDYITKPFRIREPLGLGINLLLYRVMDEGFIFAFTLPWKSYIVVAASVFAIVFFTMLYSSSKLKKENIIDSLRTWRA